MSDDKNKNAKQEPVEETALEKIKCKLIDNWKIILVALVVIIALMNTLCGMVSNRVTQAVTTEIGALRAEFAGLGTRLSELDARLSEAEKGVTVDHDALKEDVAAIRKAGEAFEKRLNAAIKAEEEKLALLEKNAANQKAYVDALKNLLEKTTQ